MNILDADTVERMLWNDGYDFTYRTDEDGQTWLVVLSDAGNLFVGEAEPDGDGWTFDSESISAFLQTDYTEPDPVEFSVSDEHSLLAEVRRVLGE